MKLSVGLDLLILGVGLLSSLKFQHQAESSQRPGCCGLGDHRLQEWIQPQRQRSCYFVVRWCARITLGCGGVGGGWHPLASRRRGVAGMEWAEFGYATLDGHQSDASVPFMCLGFQSRVNQNLLHCFPIYRQVTHSMPVLGTEHTQTSFTQNPLLKGIAAWSHEPGGSRA